MKRREFIEESSYRYSLLLCITPLPSSTQLLHFPTHHLKFKLLHWFRAGNVILLRNGMPVDKWCYIWQTNIFVARTVKVYGRLLDVNLVDGSRYSTHICHHDMYASNMYNHVTLVQLIYTYIWKMMTLIIIFNAAFTVIFCQQAIIATIISSNDSRSALIR